MRLTVPRGWEVLRHVGEFPLPVAHVDDLEALADAVREAARVDVSVPAGSAPSVAAGSGRRLAPASSGRRGHLRVVRPPGQ